MPSSNQSNAGLSVENGIKLWKVQVGQEGIEGSHSPLHEEVREEKLG